MLTIRYFVKMVIKAIIWDIGGVLVDDSKIDFWGDSQKSVDLRNKWGTGKMSFDDFVLEASNLLGMSKEDFLAVYYNAYGSHAPHFDVIEIFKSIDLPRFILSDSNKVHTEAIKREHAEWLRFANQIFFSQEIGIRKKSVEAFESVLEKIGFAAKDVLFIDNKESNISWAKKAGLNTIHYVGVKELRRELRKLGLLA